MFVIRFNTYLANSEYGKKTTVKQELNCKR